MFILRLCIVILCLVFSEGNNLYSELLSSDLYQINKPEDLGRYLQDQLTRNESKALSKECFQHIKEYAKGLLTFRLWAIAMFDANAKFPSGLLRGNAGSLGSFDQCLDITKTDEKFGTINGKYCLGVIEVQLSPTKKSKLDFSDELPVTLPEPRLINLIRTSVGFPWGVCLPDSCSAKDFQLLHLLFFLKFLEEDCQTKASQITKFNDSDKGALIFFGVIVGLIVASTLYEMFMFYRKKEQGSVLLRSFSILTNGSKILKKYENQETSCLHGIKCFSLFIIILGYRCLLQIFLPLHNWLEIAKWVLDYIEVCEGIIILDTYFLVSAVLISYNYLKFQEKGIKFNIIIYYLNRIIRFTIPLAAVILFHVTLLRHIGSGPVWLRSRDYLLVKNCQDNWWTTLLYIQNYAHPQYIDMCMLQSWHLSVDMHLFLLSPIFLLPLVKHPKFVMSALSFLIFCAMLAGFLYTWVYNLKSIVLTFRRIKDIYNYIQYYLLPTHARASAWIIGFILGYIIFKSKNIKIPINKIVLAFAALLLWIASLTVIVMCIMVASEFKGIKYNWTTHAFHRALIHPLWSLAVAWIIFACSQGYAGPINSILSVHMFQVISKISYSTFLTSLTLMSFITFQNRNGLDYSGYEAIYKAFSDLLLCLGLGFVWTISFESPFVTIAKVIFKKFEKSHRNSEVENHK